MFKRMLMAAGAAVLVQFAAAPAVMAAPPVEAFARMPAMSDVAISPDGSMIAFLSSEGEAQSLMVMKLTGEAVAGADLSGRKVRSVEWGGPNHVVVEASATSGLGTKIRGEMFQAVSLDIRTQKISQFFERTRQHRAFNVLYSDPVFGEHDGEAVAFVQGLTLKGEGRFDLYRVELDSGFAHIHEEGAEAADGSSWLVRPDGEVMARSDYDRETEQWRLLAKRGSGWERVFGSREKTDLPTVIGFGRDGRSALVAISEDKGMILHHVELNKAAGQALEAAVGDDERDIKVSRSIDDYFWARDGRLVGLGYTDVYQEYEFYDPALAATWAQLKQAFGQRQVRLESASADFSKLILFVDGAGEPGSYYSFDSTAKKLKLLGKSYPDLKPTDVAEVRQIKYKAADGLEISGYLTLPPGKGGKLPLVVMPHGGPQARDRAGFDWWAQALAARGYAVLQPNFRGSGGFGQDFVEAGHGEFGRKMQTDLSDGVKALAKQGVIDPQRVCIMGASYGGYAALRGVAMEPDVYRCAVSVAGISDLPRMLETEFRENGLKEGPALRYWKRYMGVEDIKDPALNPISPVRTASAVQDPVLLIHGKDDTVVAYEQSTVMAAALKQAGKPHEFVTLTGEDHYLSRPATRVQMLMAAIAFLEKHNPPT